VGTGGTEKNCIAIPARGACHAVRRRLSHVVTRAALRGTTETTKTGGVREIPRREWGALFLQFSRDHQEWMVDVVPHDEARSVSQEV
jgi:hypothetical protein